MNLTICQYNENVKVKDSGMCFESKEDVLMLYIEFVPLLKKGFAEASGCRSKQGHNVTHHSWILPGGSSEV